MTTSEPTINDLSPIFKPGVEREPMLLLDTTGSMSYPAADGSSVRRMDVIREALNIIVAKLAAEDSQAEEEAKTGAKDMTGEQAGGLMTVTFANGSAVDLGDLNPDNLTRKWDSIHFGGNTQIMPGWSQLVEVYMEEFGDTPKQDRPHLLATVITDGEATDTDEFARTLSQNTGGTYAIIAIVGYGEEHDRALAAYRAVAVKNDHVRVVTFDSETNPATIAEGLLSMTGA